MLPARLHAYSERIHAVTKLNALTPREHDVFRGLAGGRSNKEIANQLNLSPRTVEMHRANLMARLEVKTMAEVVRMAVTAGIEPL